MKEIKSIRVRRNDVTIGTLDIKVTIYEENRTLSPDERIIVGTNNSKTVWNSTIYKKTGLYKDFTDEQFINDFVNMNSKIEGKVYNIIQDPWEDKVPIYRNFGSDPYYLNNGAIIYIMWLDRDSSVGGRKFSDDKGNELPISDTYLDKTIKIISNKETQIFTLGKNGEFEYSNNSQVYVRTIKDKDILSEIISKWNAKIADYNLNLCSPDNESCSIIPYKSPLKPNEPEKETTPIVENTKEKISIVKQNESIKVRQDLLSLKIYIGATKEVLDNNVFDEQDNFLDGEGSEYIESDFEGVEEKWQPIPGPDDIFDPDTDKGGDEGPEPQSFVPATQTQKDFIKTAILATLSNGERHGKCARFTFNHVNNYVRLMQGKKVESGDVHNAGGNAKDNGYHRNLESMGYKIVTNESISKSSLISKIKNGSWSVGDVIVYWCTDGPSNSSHVIYGHTQIFTNGYHNNSSYRWSTDNINNYESSFVYRRKSGDSYKFIYFQAPKTKRLQDTV